MVQKKQQEYTEDKIKTLSSLEHIRLRTGMYIGRTGNGSHYDDGIYILIKEVIDTWVLEQTYKHGLGQIIDLISSWNLTFPTTMKLMKKNCKPFYYESNVSVESTSESKRFTVRVL